MTAAVVVENLLYVLGAVAGILIGALAVTLRHRRPTSTEDHVALFHKGLQALAPEAAPGRRRRAPVATRPVIVPRPPRSVRAVLPTAAAPISAPGPEPTVTEAETV
jgi:hypothetical protein